jgi:hypothetical protein
MLICVATTPIHLLAGAENGALHILGLHRPGGFLDHFALQSKSPH